MVGDQHHCAGLDRSSKFDGAAVVELGFLAAQTHGGSGDGAIAGDQLPVMGIVESLDVALGQGLVAAGQGPFKHPHQAQAADNPNPIPSPYALHQGLEVFAGTLGVGQKGHQRGAIEGDPAAVG
jgi:hypothetical protein